MSALRINKKILHTQKPQPKKKHFSKILYKLEGTCPTTFSIVNYFPLWRTIFPPMPGWRSPDIRLSRALRGRRTRPGYHLIGRELQLRETHGQAGVGRRTAEQGVRRGNGLAQRESQAKIGETPRVKGQYGVGGERGGVGSLEDGGEDGGQAVGGRLLAKEVEAACVRFRHRSRVLKNKRSTEKSQHIYTVFTIQFKYMSPLGILIRNCILAFSGYRSGSGII